MDLLGGKGLLDLQPHWVSALAWPEEGPAAAWTGDAPELLLIGRMDGSLALIEVVDISAMHRVELEHCYRKDGKRLDQYFEIKIVNTLGTFY